MRLIKTMPFSNVPSGLIELYRATGNENKHIDESDLIIFRLMGSDFRYVDVEFAEISQGVLTVVSDAS